MPHHHGVGHSAAFPERVQFPAEFGEFLARVPPPHPLSRARSAHRACRPCRRRGASRRVASRARPSACQLSRAASGISRLHRCPGALTRQLGLAQLSSARLGSPRRSSTGCLYLIWRCTDSRAKKGIGREFGELALTLSFFVRETRPATRGRGSRSPARKARRETKGLGRVNKRR